MLALMKFELWWLSLPWRQGTAVLSINRSLRLERQTPGICRGEDLTRKNETIDRVPRRRSFSTRRHFHQSATHGKSLRIDPGRHLLSGDARDFVAVGHHKIEIGVLCDLDRTRIKIGEVDLIFAGWQAMKNVDAVLRFDLVYPRPTLPFPHSVPAIRIPLLEVDDYPPVSHAR